LTWREAFASLQLEMEEKIGRLMREKVEQLNAQQDGAAAALKAAVGE
jgi:hypothetical protein